MRRPVLLTLVLTSSLAAFADSAPVSRHVDLRDDNAIAQLRQNNPHHYDRIQGIVAGLLSEPRHAEDGWLQANFDARDVDLDRMRYMTSYPPRQLLQFTLDETRYTMHLVRADMEAKAIPAN